MNGDSGGWGVYTHSSVHERTAGGSTRGRQQGTGGDCWRLAGGTMSSSISKYHTPFSSTPGGRLVLDTPRQGCAAKCAEAAAAGGRAAATPCLRLRREGGVQSTVLQEERNSPCLSALQLNITVWHCRHCTTLSVSAPRTCREAFLLFGSSIHFLPALGYLEHGFPGHHLRWDWELRRAHEPRPAASTPPSGHKSDRVVHARLGGGSGVY